MFPQDLDLGRGGGGKIMYYPIDNPPKIRPFNFNDDERMHDIMKVIFSLPDIYASEKEYRLIRVNLEIQEIPFNTESLLEIIINENMPISEIDTIKAIRDEKYPRATLSKAIFEESLYYYRFEEIT